MYLNVFSEMCYLKTKLKCDNYMYKNIDWSN